MSLLRISEAAALGLHTMALLARRQPRRLANTEIAEIIGGSANTLSKVLQRLGKEGLIASVRGPGGGFELARPAREITMLEVFEAIDGRIDEAVCVLGHPFCRSSECILGGMIQQIQELVAGTFAATTVDKLASSMKLGDAIYGDPEDQ